MSPASPALAGGFFPYHERHLGSPRDRELQKFPGGSDGKASVYNAGDPGSIPGLGRSPGEGNGNPLQDCCLENPMDKRSLVGYSPWGCKESDTTERLHFHFILIHKFPIRSIVWNRRSRNRPIG